MRNRQSGITLIETLIAGVIILIVFAFLSQALVSSLKLSKRASNRLESNLYAAAVAEMLSQRHFSGAETGFLIANSDGLRLIPGGPAAPPPPGAVDALRYSAATSPVQGENMIRIVVAIHDSRGVQTQAVAAYAAH